MSAIDPISTSQPAAAVWTSRDVEVEAQQAAQAREDERLIQEQAEQNKAVDEAVDNSKGNNFNALA
ncbi:MAG: hypothetical protein V1816_02675 [Pseudomonadota bacterium]